MRDTKPPEINDEFENRLTELEKTTVNLINSIAESNVMIDKLTVKIDTLADVQKETDERLNAVIFKAEKFFGNPNGKSE